MEGSCQVAKLEGDLHRPWFIIERVATSDGVRTRVCDGFWATKREAQQHCDWKNRP